MDKIKTPIRYSERSDAFWDANDNLITDGEVANALNAAADQSRVIAVLTEALEYAIQASAPTHQYATEANIALKMIWDKLAKALAEAQRIQEGK